MKKNNLCGKSLLPAILGFSLSLISIFQLQASAGSADSVEGISVKRETGAIPHLIFACELDSQKLDPVFSDTAMINELKKMNAGIAIAIMDMSNERARVVKKLNQAGIGVTAWLVLPRDEGYYFNINNADDALKRYEDFQQWTKRNALHWEAVGLDIEPDFNELSSLRKEGKWKLYGTLFKRAINGKKLKEATDKYKDLVRKIKNDKYYLQTYQLQFVSDARKAHTDILGKAIGIVDVHGDDEVLMLYSSFNPTYGSALIWGYGKDAQTIAIGSTSETGDSIFNAAYPPLSWKEFTSDLITASHFSHNIGIFSLEGCIQQGFITRLQHFDWDQTIVIPKASVQAVGHFRHFVILVLWILSNLLYIVIFFILLVTGLIWWIRRGKRKKKIPASS